MTNPSNSSPTPFPGDDRSHLDADLRSLDAALEMLAAAELGTADSQFEDRLMQATLASLHGVEPIAARAAELGAMDRGAAPEDLEEGVYAESVPALRDGAGTVAVPMLRHVGQAERSAREHVRVVRRVWWANQYARLAAAVVLVTGLGIMLRSSRSPVVPTNTTDSEELASRVNGEMNLLFAAMENKPATSDPSDAGTANDPDDLTKWLMEGAAS